MSIEEDHSRDKKMIEKLRQIVLENLSNEQFGVEELTKTYGLSRSQLHRKLKKINGKSISQFIREIRLQKALELLQKDVSTVSEIAYQVGFSSPTYFNTCFREYFGFPPGEAKLRSILPQSEEPLKAKRIQGKRKWIGVGLIVSLLIVLSWFAFNRTQPKHLSETNQGDLIEKSIAVLPFKNWSGDPALEYVSDGMTDAVISRLARIHSIERVIPFTSVAKYKTTSKTIPEIARELSVRNVLQGNFQISGNQVKINLQLVDGLSDNHFWSEDYTGEWHTNDIFKIQAAVAENIAKYMQAEMTDIEMEAIKKFPTQNKEAYDLYLKAEYLNSKDDANNFESAIALYEEAISMDENFVEAYIGLANTHIIGGFLWGVFDEQNSWEKAKGLLQKALEIDRNNIKTHEELFAGYFYYDWDFEKAEAYYRGELPGNDLKIRRRQTTIYYSIKTGRADKALEEIEKNISADPSDRLQYVQKADALFFLDDRKGCSEILRSYGPYFKDSFYHLVQTARLHYYLGEHEKARDQLQLLKDKFPGRPPIVLWLEAVYQEMDVKEGGINESVGILHQKYKDRASGSPAWFLALYYSHIENYEETLYWLQKSYDRHEVEMTWLKEEPPLRPLRSDPRYIELYKRVGFPFPITPYKENLP